MNNKAGMISQKDSTQTDGIGQAIEEKTNNMMYKSLEKIERLERNSKNETRSEDVERKTN